MIQHHLNHLMMIVGAVGNPPYSLLLFASEYIPGTAQDRNGEVVSWYKRNFNG